MAQGAVVYEIKNNITGQVYIGVTVDFERRKAEHFSIKHWIKQPDKVLYKNIQQYGARNFDMSITSEHASLELALEQEKRDITHVIADYGSDKLLNRSLGGEVGSVGANYGKPIKTYVVKVSLGVGFEDTVINEFNSQTAAARFLGEGQQKVSAALRSESGRIRNYLVSTDLDELKAKYEVQRERVYSEDTGRHSKLLSLPVFLGSLNLETNYISNKDIYSALGMTREAWSNFSNTETVEKLLADFGWERIKNRRGYARK